MRDTTIWSAPPKRSGDGALDLVQVDRKQTVITTNTKAVSPLRFATALQMIGAPSVLIGNQIQLLSP